MKTNSTTAIYLRSFITLILFGVIVFSAQGTEKITKKYDIGDFTRIYLEGPYKVELIQDTSCGLTIIAPKAAFDLIDISSADGLLSIEIEDKFFKKPKVVTLEIHVKQLSKLTIEGAVDLETRGTIKTDNLKINFEGAGNMEMDIDASKIIAIIEGVGNFEFSGKTEYHKVEFSGVGSYDASNLISKYTYVESYGIGNVKVHASYEIRGEVSGVGSVDYYGDPDITDVETSGVGGVRRH